MKNGLFESRREQIESVFLKDVKDRMAKSMKAALRDAAIVAACEERSRCLAILKTKIGTTTAYNELVKAVCAKPVVDVLGYDSF